MSHNKPGIRKIILASAGVIFLRLGYDRTTTSLIADGAGVSRSTIWRHFQSKEDIFREYIRSSVLFFLVDNPDVLASDANEDTLREYCRKYMAAIHAPDSLALYRLILSSGTKFEHFGSDVMKLVLGAGNDALVAFVTRCMANGTIRSGEPKDVAWAIFSLCEGPRYHQALLGLPISSSEDLMMESNRVADLILAMFGSDIGIA